MWGNTLIEALYINNFNTGFSSIRSSVIIHLAQWQYWWWFWFTFLWSFYFILILRVIRYRRFKLHPKITTSLRSHGKWGDFLAGILPVIWCLNILTNSNFILRLLEWQNEIGLFTLRIRAKQWYWVYKYDLRIMDNFLSIPKNIGWNKWMFFTFGDLKITDNYIHTMHMYSQYKLINKNIKNINYNFNIENYKLFNNKINYNFVFNTNDQIWINKIYINKFNFLNISYQLKSNLFKNKTNNLIFLKNHTNLFYKNVTNDFVNTNFFIQKSVRFIKNSILFNKNYNNDKILFKLKFNNNVNYCNNYNLQMYDFLNLKQKRYVRTPIYFKNKNVLNNKIMNKTTSQSFFNPNNYIYNLWQQNRIWQSKLPNFLYLRLLRTKRVLVLPAHINITLITNSYDVIHSWFVPSLGIKLDCVPGRSTHHTFFIDNIGFYFGQCAEICGRYHHHMPIRLCALSFEQFLIWWQVYGLTYINKISENSKNFNKYVFYKYVW